MTFPPPYRGSAEARPLALAFDGMGRWEQFVAGYSAFQQARGLAPRTIENRALTLRALSRRLAKPIDQVSFPDLLAWLGRGVSPASMQRERSDILGFFTWAKSQKLLSSNPAKRLPKITVARNKPRPLTIAQIEAMLASGARRRTRMMILLGYAQGMRAHEIAKFRGEDIDWISETVRVVGKGRHERIMPLHPLVAAEAVYFPREGVWFPGRKGREGTHISYRSVSDLMRRALDRAGITNARLTGHSLRHSFATELLDSGVDIRVVQELLGHLSLNSTQIYTGVNNRKKREGMDRLPTLYVPDRAGRPAA